MPYKALSVRIDKKNYDFVKLLSAEEKKDTSELIRKLLEMRRAHTAVEKYKKRTACLGKASKIAGVPISKMIDILAEYGIETNFEKEIESLRKRFLGRIKYNLRRNEESGYDSKWLENYPKWKTAEYDGIIEKVKNDPDYYCLYITQWKEAQKRFRNEYGKDFNKKTKSLILKRDNYSCRDCGSTVQPLNVHHMDRNKKNNKHSNLITLCKECHGRQHF